MAADEHRKKNRDQRLDTRRPIPAPAAPIISTGSMGDAVGAGVVSGHVVGTFRVDFRIVVAVWTTGTAADPVPAPIWVNGE